MKVDGGAVGAEKEPFTDANIGAGDIDSLLVRSLSEQKNAAAGARESDGMFNDAGGRRGYDDGVGTPSAGHIEDAIEEPVLAGVQSGRSAKTQRQITPMRHRVGGQYSRTGSFHKHGEQKSDGALPEDDHNIAGLRVELDHSFQASVHRLDETCLVEGDTFGNFFDAAPYDPIHDADVLRETSASRLVTGGDADLLINRALSIKPMPAVETIQARNVMKDDDAIADGIAANAGADRGHHAGRLMAVDARRLEQIVFNLLKIGVADTAALDPDEQFAGTDFGGRNRLD